MDRVSCLQVFYLLFHCFLGVVAFKQRPCTKHFHQSKCVIPTFLIKNVHSNSSKERTNPSVEHLFWSYWKGHSFSASQKAKLCSNFITNPAAGCEIYTQIFDKKWELEFQLEFWFCFHFCGKKMHMKKLFTFHFVLSLLSFANNQHLKMEKNKINLKLK